MEEKFKKPPLGLMPEKYWNRQRIIEIIEATNRYVQEDEKIPIEWIKEYNRLIDNHKKVICIDDSYICITKGKFYYVISEDEKYYVIKTDCGDEQSFNKSRFLEV